LNNNDKVWNFDNVPQEFWQRIEETGGNIEKFKENLQAFSEAELKEIFAQYKGLSQFLVMEGFTQFPQILKEESVETLEEIANWVITQGRSKYEEILKQPEQFPLREDVRRPIFAGAIISVYTHKFGPWRA